MKSLRTSAMLSGTWVNVNGREFHEAGESQLLRRGSLSSNGMYFAPVIISHHLITVGALTNPPRRRTSSSASPKPRAQKGSQDSHCLGASERVSPPRRCQGRRQDKAGSINQRAAVQVDTHIARWATMQTHGCERVRKV